VALFGKLFALLVVTRNIIRNLWRMVWRVLWYPLSLVWRHSFGLLLLASMAYVIYIFTKDDTPAQPTGTMLQQPASGNTSDNYGTTSRAAPKAPVAPAGPIDPVLKEEDGNSMFSTDLMKVMTEEELGYYSQVFQWAMQRVPTGTTHNWNNANTYGSITPGKPFQNGQKVYCREFEEVLKVHSIRQTISGVSCQRKSGGWCKLRNTSTPACGIHTTPSFGEKFMRSIDIF